MLSARVACVAVILFVAILASVTAQSLYTRKLLTGNDVTLPCDYSQADDGNWFLITWAVMIEGNFRNLYVRSPGSTDNQVTPPAQFAGRISIDGERMLKLTGVTIADDDEYRCTVAATNNRQTLVNLQVFKQPTRPDVQVQYEPQPSDMSAVPLNTTVTFTCSSTGGRPPASLGWSVTESGTPVAANPTYTSSNDSLGVGDATSTFNFTTTTYGLTYRVQCTASGPDPIQTRTSAITSFTTESDPSATPSTPKGQTGVVTSAPNTASKSSGPGVSKAPQTGGLSPGAQAGLGVGIALACIIGAGVLAYFFVVRKKRTGREKDDGVESGDDAVTYHSPGHPGAPENLSRSPPNEPEVMYAELDLKNAPAGSRRPYVATPDDSPTEYAHIRPDKPPRSSVPHTLAPDDKTEYASISKPKPSRRLDLQAV